MLVINNISKKFPGVTALDQVSMEFYPGMVNALIGENGAGKSTLMKIISGVQSTYEGEIVYKGAPVRFTDTRQAEEAGIAIIHQELNLVPGLSITENIFLGKELLGKWGTLDKRKMSEQTRQLLTQLKMNVRPGTKVASLKVGQQQLVEIAKALLVKAEVIIMDEPTSAISDKEVETLFGIINELKAEGKTIIYISHKLNELFRIADRYIVMRDGKVAGVGLMKDASPDALIRKMVGRQIESGEALRGVASTDELLSVKNICLFATSTGKKIVRDISFSLYKGEILGIYGLLGSGRSELLETIVGLHAKRCSGLLYLEGKSQQMKTPAHAIQNGMVLVPEDRKIQGLILSQDVKTNVSISVLGQLQKWGLILDRAKEAELVSKFIGQLSIKTSSQHTNVNDLSGGNQQKVVLAKCLATSPKVLLLDEPTRGIDVNAKYELYRLLRQLAATGMGIILVSSELPEILAVSNRVLVMAEGRLAADLPVEEASEDIILRHAIHKN